MTIAWTEGATAPVERASFADGVHAVRVGGDLVLLDLAADDYLCLPDCGALEISGRDVCGGVDAILRLAAEELLHPSRRPNDRASPLALPMERLPAAPPTRPTARDVAAFGKIWFETVLRRPTLSRLSDRYASRKGQRDDLAAVAERVEVFRQLLPLAPWTGECLFQAELLLRFLNAAGLDADWVFGVRTFPFLAHCWLQIGPCCVSEAPETLTVYRPILVV